MQQAKFCIYGMIVVGYVVAGGIDLAGHNLKAGATAIGFGIINLVIFFWRE